jgi:hypothetical protein
VQPAWVRIPRGIPLHGSDLIQAWQARIDQFSDDLAAGDGRAPSAQARKLAFELESIQRFAGAGSKGRIAGTFHSAASTREWWASERPRVVGAQIIAHRLGILGMAVQHALARPRMGVADVLRQSPTVLARATAAHE